jgi:hypothetical protein
MEHFLYRTLASSSAESSTFFKPDPRLLHLAIWHQPDERFIVKIDNLNPVPPRIPKITAERRLQCQFVFSSQLLAHLGELLLIADHDSEMPHVRRLNFLHLENREKLMFAQFEKRVAFAAIELFQIENILVKFYRLADVVHLDGDMITAINLHAHQVEIAIGEETGSISLIVWWPTLSKEQVL